jgi:hypothetical protein
MSAGLLGWLPDMFVFCKDLESISWMGPSVAILGINSFTWSGPRGWLATHARVECMIVF